MNSKTLTIAARFRGPPHSANGGYVSGCLAAHVGSSACVTLHSPPPLDTPLQIEQSADSTLQLLHERTVVASARTATATSDFSAVVDFAAARAASERTFPPEKHKIPGCFVCGPDRAPGDGLRIHPGPLAAGDESWSGTLAAPWIPAKDLADADGKVLAAFVWAALDCPTAYACSDADGMPPILLGRQTVSLVRRPRAEERCVIVAETRGRERRKHYADAALYDASGACIAICNAIWIDVSDARINRNG